jgi:D-alanine-D-alanine ligase
VRITILCTPDAAGPPQDPVLAQVEEALRGAGHETTRVVAGPDVGALVGALRAADPALVFNMAESFDGRSALESSVAGLLNLIGLRYTGSSPAGLLLAGDKVLSKKVLGFHGIRSPEFATTFRGSVEWAGSLRFPVIVKPPQEDASIGIGRDAVVRDLQGLLERMHALHGEFRQPVLVEEFVEGREFYVGVLGNAHPEALPPVELRFEGFPEGAPRIASWEAKWGDAGGGEGARDGGDAEAERGDAPPGGAEFAGTRSVVAEGLAPALSERLRAIAVECYEALRLRDYARVDLRVNEAGEVYVIEVNPNCYLERSAEFAMAAGAAGLGYEALVARIVELATARYAR